MIVETSHGVKYVMYMFDLLGSRLANQTSLSTMTDPTLKQNFTLQSILRANYATCKPLLSFLNNLAVSF